MTDFKINDYELRQEAKRLAQECFDNEDEGGNDPNDYLWQTCDGHEWVIYTYKALLLCAECDTSEGEAYLEGLDLQHDNLGSYASAVAFATLYCAAMDELEGLHEKACIALMTV